VRGSNQILGGDPASGIIQANNSRGAGKASNNGSYPKSVGDFNDI